MAPHFSTSFTMHPTPPPSSANSESRATILPNQPIMMRRTSLDVMLASPQPTGLARRDSNLASSLGGSANSDELDDRTFSPISSSTSASTPMLSMTSYAPTMLPFKQHPLSPPSYMDDHSFPNNLQQMQIDTSTPPLDQQVFNQPQPPQQSRYDPYVPQRPRRRREMQAITKIVETRDHPYIDGYFWKNNGNTVQKKTGNRSVYYKCSNSSKGCPVNKTVTWKDNGEYLIKYRGDHLLDCGKVQRIVDM
ncbi:hypothetical protein J3Q64DRAFT_1725019 [Phycomyces blakesleeanus]|uniref:WRKY domain-containing protein n=1 Tax=Phycomyces blakesleeanus TaxID=4837 RepID=A0ABR3B6W0_PHYBL